MRTDGEIDRLLRDEAERWRTGVPAAGDVDAGRFTDGSTPGRIPRTLIAALSTAALAAVFVAVIGSSSLPVVDPVGSATLGPPGAEATPDPFAGLEIIRPGDTVTATGQIVVHNSGDVFLCPTSAIVALPAGVDLDATCIFAPLLPLRGVGEDITFTWASVVGTWRGDAVDVQDIRRVGRSDRDWWDHPSPCEPPDVYTDPAGIDREAAAVALEREVSDHPDRYVGLWSARAESAAGATSPVLVVGTVDDVASARSHLWEVYPFPESLCVVEVDFSRAELEQVEEELASLQGPSLSVDIDAAVDRVVVWTNALDPATAEAIVPFLDKIEVRATVQLIRAAPETTDGPEPTLVCGRINQEDCEASVAIVRAQHEAAVDGARAIVVDDACPPTMACDRMYPFAVFVVLLPLDAGEPIQAFQVVGTDGPEGIFGSSPSIPQHIHELIATVSPSVEPEPSAQPAPSACRPEGFLQVLRRVLVDYEPVDSPRQLARMSDLVVIGRVVAGTGVASETRGVDTHLAVHVSEVVRGNPDLVVDGRIFVDVTGDVSSTELIHGVSGCDVLLFLGQRDNGHFAAGAQGFWIQSDSGLIGVHVPLESSPPGWGHIASIDDLRFAAGYTSAEREAAMFAVIEAVNTDPDHFGVPYLDDDGALVVQYVDEAARAALEAHVDPAVTVRWERVDYTQSELMRIAGEISDLDLVGVFGISSGTKENRVIVRIGPGGSLAEVSELLTARYGDAVRVEFSTDIPTVGG